MYVTAAHVYAQEGVVSVLQECTRLYWDPSQRLFGLLQLDRDEEKSLKSRPARELDTPLTASTCADLFGWNNALQGQMRPQSRR